MEKIKGIKDFYNITANDWANEWYSNETMLPLLKKFVALFDDKPHVLDAGCGAGYESMRLANLGADVVGVDISEESIKIARDKNPNCRFEIIDCKDLDISIGTFDGIVAIALLVHIKSDELQLIFDNFKKITKSKGYLFIAFAEGNGFDEKKSYAEINGEQYNRAFYRYQVDNINKTAKNAGFNYVEEWFLSDEPITHWKYLLYQAD